MTWNNVRRQVFQQTRQINDLQDAIRQKDAELRDLREVAEAAAELQSTDQQAAKIIDLSKKVGIQATSSWKVTSY